MDRAGEVERMEHGLADEQTADKREEGRNGAVVAETAAASAPESLGAGGGLYAVGELAQLAGVSTRTIRYYEEIGLLATARRFSGGRRAFDRDALERLHFIGRLKRLGLPLEEIRHLNEVHAVQHSTSDMLTVLDDLLGQHLETIAARLEELSALRAEIGDYRAHVRGRLERSGETAVAE